MKDSGQGSDFEPWLSESRSLVVWRDNVMKLMARCIVAVLMFTQSANSFSHGGGLDEYGCHTDTSTGDYHCHRSTSSSDSSSDGAGILLGLILLASLVSVSMRNDESVKLTTDNVDTSSMGISPLPIDGGLGVKLWIRF